MIIKQPDFKCFDDTVWHKKLVFFAWDAPNDRFLLFERVWAKAEYTNTYRFWEYKTEKEYTEMLLEENNL